MIRYITEEYRKNLSTYKYSGVDKSLISQYILSPYWNWLVQQFPLWMAPNLITFIGFCICVGNLLTLLYFSPDLAEPCPNWVYFTFGIGLFAYQSLDAIDGKQARRTNSGSPLGELFDHGCDALNTSIGVLLGTSMLNAHQSWWLALSAYAALANFYLSTWEEYYTGTLYLSYFSGPVEGVVILAATHLVTSVVGPPFWETPVAEFLLSTKLVGPAITGLVPSGLQLNHLLILTTNATTVLNAITSIGNVKKARRKAGKSVKEPLEGLLPFLACGLSGFFWLWSHPEVISHHMVPFVLFVGVMFGYTVGTMITAHVTKAPFPMRPNVLMLLFFVMSGNAALGAFLGRSLLYPRASERQALLAAFVLSAAVYLHFAWSVIQDICEYKGIYCFKLGRRPGASEEEQLKKAGKAQ